MPKITESRVSFTKRIQEDFETELGKALEEAPTQELTNHKFFMRIIRIFQVINTRLKNVEDWLKEQEEANAKAANRFHKCNSVSEVIAQAVGAGSTAWVGGTGAAIFDSEEATAIAVEATERVRELRNL